MKRIIIAAIAVGITAGVAQAQTNQVLSRNAVGYERINVPPRGNGFALTRLDFIGLGGDITISNMLGNQLPDGSRIILFNKNSQTYTFLTKARGSWPQGTTVVDTAVGFFLDGQTNIGSTNYTVYLMGEVPDRFTQATNTETGVGGLTTPFQLSGYPYPTAVAWSNVTLLNALSNGAQVITFDGTNYTFHTKARGAFPPALTTNTLQVGQGFFIRSTQAVNWVEVKPYTWP